MKKLFLILLIFVALPCYGQVLCGITGARNNCNPATDEVGDRTEHAENYDVVDGRILCFLYTPDCYGTLGYGYSMHEGTANDSGMICVYKDDGDSTPDQDAGDTLVACSGEIATASDDTWIQTGTKIGGTLTSGNYWVCTVGTANSWKVRYDSTGTRTVYLANGFNYASPPATFEAVDFAGTASKDGATYVAVE